MRETIRCPALASGRVDLFQQRFGRGADLRLFLQKFREKIFNQMCIRDRYTASNGNFDSEKYDEDWDAWWESYQEKTADMTCLLYTSRCV